MAPDPRPLPRIVPRLVSRNWRLKISALGLAVFLWALVRSEPATGVNLFTVPVRAQVGDLDWVLAGDPEPATVQVRLRGPTEDLIALASDGTTLRVPLDTVWGADTVVQLRRDWVILGDDSELVVEDITPGAVRLELQRTVTRTLPLGVPTRGSLPGDQAFAAPLGLNPQTVRVRGPAHLVAPLDTIRLQPLDLGELERSGTYPLTVDTTGLDGVSVAPLTATASVRLEPETDRVLSDVPVRVEGGGEGIVVTPGTIEVTVRGARTPVAGTRPEEVEALVSSEALASLGPGGRRTVPIRLRGLPPLVRAFSETDSVVVRRLAP